MCYNPGERTRKIHISCPQLTYFEPNQTEPHLFECHAFSCPLTVADQRLSPSLVRPIQPLITHLSTVFWAGNISQGSRSKRCVRKEEKWTRKMRVLVENHTSRSRPPPQPLRPWTGTGMCHSKTENTNNVQPTTNGELLPGLAERWQRFHIVVTCHPTLEKMTPLGGEQDEREIRVLWHVAQNEMGEKWWMTKLYSKCASAWHVTTNEDQLESGLWHSGWLSDGLTFPTLPLSVACFLFHATRKSNYGIEFRAGKTNILFVLNFIYTLLSFCNDGQIN